MALITEIYLNSKIAYHYFDAVQPIIPINKNTDRTKIVVKSKDLEFDHIGIRFPLKVSRIDKKTSKHIELEGKISVPISCVLSMFEFEYDIPDDEKKLKIGFAVDIE